MPTDPLEGLFLSAIQTEAESKDGLLSGAQLFEEMLQILNGCRISESFVFEHCIFIGHHFCKRSLS